MGKCFENLELLYVYKYKAKGILNKKLFLYFICRDQIKIPVKSASQTTISQVFYFPFLKLEKCFKHEIIHFLNKTIGLKIQIPLIMGVGLIRALENSPIFRGNVHQKMTSSFCKISCGPEHYKRGFTFITKGLDFQLRHQNRFLRNTVHLL